MIGNARLRALVAISSMIIAVGSVARAAVAPPATAAQVKAVIDCRAISEDQARLACFDAAVSAMSAAEKSGELLILDREQRRAVRRESFGLTPPSFDIFSRGEKPEEANRLTAHVGSASLNAEGKWVIRLDDGALWQQTDDDMLEHSPHAGSTVVIFRGVLGSFFLKVDGQRAIRARRVH